MQKEKYYEYLEKIMKEDLTEKEKIALIKMLEVLRVACEEDLKDYEASSYKTNHKPLSESERINYEINRLLKKAIKEGNEYLETELKVLAYENISKYYDNKQDIKRKITRLQVIEGITPRFYTAFEKVLQEPEKMALLKEEKPRRTFKK